MKKLQEFYEFIKDNKYDWTHHIEYDSDNSLKEFSKEEQGYGFTFNIVTFDKTDDARCIVKREVHRQNVYTIYPERGERYIDLNFLMYKALKIMRENPDLEVEIILVSNDSYGYDFYNGTFAPTAWLEEDGKPEPERKPKKTNAPKT